MAVFMDEFDVLNRKPVNTVRVIAFDGFQFWKFSISYHDFLQSLQRYIGIIFLILIFSIISSKIQ